MSSYKVDSNFGMYEYLRTVEEIVSGYINRDTGVYEPHIGMINAMRVFYNECVVSCDMDAKYPHNVMGADEMAEIVKDAKFVDEFNKSICAFDKNMGADCYGFNFANAFKDAMEIVNYKKSTIGGAVTVLGSIAVALAEKVAPFLTDENVKAVADIASGIKDGKVSAEDIVQAYAKITNNKS